jgi:hypothetical protein
MKPTVWLVLEFNCYEPSPDRASVWISGRPLSPDKALEEDVARKLVGPVPTAEAERIIQALRSELEFAGVEVILESAADD